MILVSKAISVAEKLTVKPASGTYRSDIDGLRAVAVMAVVFNHLYLSFYGGYIGVDIFFVISGYLITRILIREHSEGRFSFSHFWERRARRILPALAFMILCTLAIGSFFLMPFDFEELGKATLSQVYFSGNHHYYQNGNYFSLPLSQRFLIHTWSLAVEEQFYFVFPFLVCGIFYLSRKNKLCIPPILPVFVILLISLGLAVILTSTGRVDAAFYLLPPRAWELLCGALLAMLPPHLVPLKRIYREALTWIGLSMIITACFLYSSATLFPGWTAILPCFGTMLLIWGNTPIPNQRPTTLSTLLSLAPVVWIGLISYSLYLWHWPIWVFANYWSLQAAPSVPNRILLLALCFLAAWLSWYFIETPFRLKRWCKTQRQMFVFSGAVLVFFLFAGGTIVASKGFVNRFDPTTAKAMLANDEARRDTSDINRQSAEDILQERIPRFGIEQDGSPQVLLWGDSHAMCAKPAIDDLCKELNLSGVMVADWGWKPLLETSSDPEFGKQRKALKDLLQKHQFPYIILISKWHTKQTTDFTQLSQDLISTLKELGQANAQVWVVMQIPIYELSIPVTLSKEQFLMTRDGSWRQKAGSLTRANKFLLELGNSGATSARFIDPRKAFTREGDPFYIVENEGRSLYWDGDHLNSKGAKAVLLPLFRETIGADIRKKLEEVQ